MSLCKITTLFMPVYLVYTWEFVNRFSTEFSIYCSDLRLLLVNYLKTCECFLASKSKMPLQSRVRLIKKLLKDGTMLVLLISHQPWITNFGFVMLNHIETINKK